MYWSLSVGDLPLWRACAKCSAGPCRSLTQPLPGRLLVIRGNCIMTPMFPQKGIREGMRMGLEAEIDRLSRELGEALQARGWLAATAESCTGGGVATAITDIAGSSGWFDRGFVTYTNEAKQQMLGVSIDSLLRHGAVSEAVVLEMARGGLARSDAGICVAISGIAGPGGGSDDKPVGTVWFAWADRTGRHHSLLARFDGDRHQVRQQAVRQALSGLLALLR